MLIKVRLLPLTETRDRDMICLDYISKDGYQILEKDILSCKTGKSL